MSEQRPEADAEKKAVDNYIRIISEFSGEIRDSLCPDCGFVGKHDPNCFWSPPITDQPAGISYWLKPKDAQPDMIVEQQQQPPDS